MFTMSSDQDTDRLDSTTVPLLTENSNCSTQSLSTDKVATLAVIIQIIKVPLIYVLDLDINLCF